MRFTIFLILTLLFATLELHAKPSPQLEQSVALKAPKPPDNVTTILFEVTAPETNHTSYLFGTHHAFGKSFFDSLSIAKEKLLRSAVLIKENLDIPGREAKDIINNRSKTTNWSRYLNQEDLQYINTLFANSETDVHKMTPTELFAFLNRYYKENVCGAKSPDDPRSSLDNYIGEIATDHQLQLIGLETLEEQFEIIRKDVAGMPRKVHKKRLARLIDRLSTNTPDNCQEIDWYTSMDFDYRFDQSCRNALVLTDRNEKWLPKIEEHIKANACFIAVGLSHLMFECGLIQQLRAKGYDVKPIPVK